MAYTGPLSPEPSVVHVGLPTSGSVRWRMRLALKTTGGLVGAVNPVNAPPISRFRSPLLEKYAFRACTEPLRLMPAVCPTPLVAVNGCQADPFHRARNGV